jgi:3-phytase
LEKPIEPYVFAVTETPPMAAEVDEDAADDSAIWVHPTDPSRSVIYGTHKKSGLALYSLKGEELAFLPIGKVNNVDVRQDFATPNGLGSIVAMSNRSYKGIDVFFINNEDGTLSPATQRNLRSAVDDIYGFCLYTSRISGRTYAFANGKNGVIEQWLLDPQMDGTIAGRIVRSLSVPSQPEGMVADDAAGRLFVGEENNGIWAFDAEPDAPTVGKRLPASGAGDNPAIAHDIEGLALYLDDSGGYLIASSQGNNSYAIFDRLPPHTYRGSFSISDSGNIDGVEETDGIEVTSLPLGAAFPEGLLIAQDGYNFAPDGRAQSQNFKLVDWQAIAEALGL